MEEEGYIRMSRQRERELEVIDNEMDRILLGLDDADPLAAERRLACMSERVREEVWAMRGIAAGMKRACRCGISSRVPPGTPGRLIKFRVEGGKVVRESDEVIPANRRAVGGSSSSASAAAATVAAAARSEDELCTAFGSARF